ncbi:MAG: asparagine synthase (glutamine-hydrolyzing), partial [Flavobacterium sp.]
MCGFAGLYNESRPNGLEQTKNLLKAMGDAIAHRGPDDEGVWYDAADNIGFSHRRLSVIDLSPAGHQPMESRCRRYVIVYNGEIYNHLHIRVLLKEERRDVAWRGHSDTETLLTAIEVWGLEHTLKIIQGMFAFAIWDKQQKALYLARDRVGEKPLYYGWQDDTFLFGSELKALKAHPDFKSKIDRGALTLFLRHNYVPGPYSIYKGIKKLPAGTFLKIETGNEAGIQKGQEKPEPYWDFAQVAKSGLESPFAGGESEALKVLEEKLGSAVAGQMLSDVPLGALLSGGVDSS